MKPKLLLIGGGGHCKAVIDVIEHEGRYEIAGILDMPERVGDEVLGIPVIGSDDAIEQKAAEGYTFLITVGQIASPDTRMALYARLKDVGARLATVVSPLAYVSPHAVLEEGSVVMHRALVNADARVGCNCIVNTCALIEHDAAVEAHCHISTGAILNGGVVVKEGSFIGSGAVCKEYVTVSERSFVKAASLYRGDI